MSLYASLFSGVSGLAANSSAMGMISDNIVNINTVGYKGTQAKFSSLVTESNSTASYSPGGVIAKPQALISHQGLLQGSTSATDLSIDGSGFFVVANQADAQNADATISFTRAGSFTPDDAGFLQNTAGLYLQGYALDSNGAVQTEGIQELVPINVARFTSSAEPTSSVAIRANLQSSQTINPLVAGLPYNNATAAGSMAGYDADVVAGAPVPQGIKPDFQTSVQVYDARGELHSVTFAALKQTDNTWNAEIFVSPPSDISGPTVAGTGQIAAGQIVFNGDGTIDTTATSAALLAPLGVNWTGGTDAGQITFNLGTDGESDGISEFAGESTVISTTANGAKFGSVIGVSVNEEGVVTALFNNGLARDVFQLPIQTFQNPDGLTRRQGNSYTISDASGEGSLKLAGRGGAGLVAPSTLEASTVDLASEFTNLITVQRAFSASTKIITTADEMLDELNRIKR